MTKHFILLFLTFLLIGCAPQPINPTSTEPVPTSLPSTASEAHDALVNFLARLHAKNYAEAVPLYGGEYEQLQVFNPEIDPNDKVALWTWVCDNQLLQCLEVRSTAFKEQVGDSYIFQVEFNNPDGSLFVLGPCCGATETEMPPVSQFEFTVTRNSEGKFVVMNTPPYVP
ncbi:MAG TPA: hypothetical protein VFY83_17345 [Anaerolineales bacterium]|nr:hypothetical protein [Anaerolineales bacterium]